MDKEEEQDDVLKWIDEGEKEELEMMDLREKNWQNTFQRNKKNENLKKENEQMKKINEQIEKIWGEKVDENDELFKWIDEGEKEELEMIHNHFKMPKIPKDPYKEKFDNFFLELMGMKIKKDEMKISRIWAMPNRYTFQIKPIKELIKKYMIGKKRIIDPFAGESKIDPNDDGIIIRNDLNEKYDMPFHMDALDFLKRWDDDFAEMVLYDPPYSLRQIKECYEGVGKKLTFEDTQSSWRAKQLDEIARILKMGGICISFGWNTNGVGKKRGFEIIEILDVAHGGSHNDTLCTVEKKIKEIDLKKREQKV